MHPHLLPLHTLVVVRASEVKSTCLEFIGDLEFVRARLRGEGHGVVEEAQPEVRHAGEPHHGPLVKRNGIPNGSEELGVCALERGGRASARGEAPAPNGEPLRTGVSAKLKLGEGRWTGRAAIQEPRLDLVPPHPLPRRAAGPVLAPGTLAVDGRAGGEAWPVARIPCSLAHRGGRGREEERQEQRRGAAGHHLACGSLAAPARAGARELLHF
mmetsp:Transcript_8453/g.21067  ORF Transcript_8453/g.21067 Transcript_8453/m.21067 type:complete len:213 (-) Transcript_8453:28-666(-)